MSENKILDKKLIAPSATISFADVAHQTLIFDAREPASSLVLSLLDTAWVQRLRNIRQTGNTHLVYMFAEHSRFGHSLGVAYLAIMLMKHLAKQTPELIAPYQEAVAAAALLHDIGHTAPGSHLAERIWNIGSGHHEALSCRIIREDKDIKSILSTRSTAGETLGELACKILEEDKSLPPWTSAIISGGGWNADRGNWAIVDSAMCSVSYGRYNVAALIDAFRLTERGELVLQENRLDALTHFFVARDSMYRQVYQHRVLQAVDTLTANVVLRLRDILADCADDFQARKKLEQLKIFFDDTMLTALLSNHKKLQLDINTDKAVSLQSVFKMTEGWWRYHLDRWCECDEAILRDLALRLRDRRLLKTIRLANQTSLNEASGNAANQALIEKTEIVAKELGFDPRYYVSVIHHADMHRGKNEEPPLVLLDSGKVVPVTEVEPMIAKLVERAVDVRTWLAVPKEVKERLGFLR